MKTTRIYLRKCNHRPGDIVMVPTATKKYPDRPRVSGVIVARCDGEAVDRMGRYMVRVGGDSGYVFAHESEVTKVEKSG